MGRFGGPVGRVGAKMRHGAQFVCGMWKAGILTFWSHLTRSLTESGGWALQVRWTENSRVMLRAVMICGVLTASAVFVAQRLQGFGWDAAWSGLLGLPAGQVGLTLMAVAVAASTAFALPMGYQTHMMVYGPGGYRFSDFLRVGIPLNLICWVVSCLLIPFIWPF